MKIKKFNESSNLEPVNISKIDPYGEEDWEDKNKVDYSQSPGICYNCGSQNLDYDDTEIFDNAIGYKYTCNDCNSNGMEVYDLVFVVNEKD